MFSFKRTFTYYLYRAYLPTMVLMVFNFGSYWVPPSAIPARVTLIVTTMLANAFILQSATEETVKVNYTTPMQLFLIINVMFIVTAIVQYLVVLLFRTRHKKNVSFDNCC